MIVLFESIPKVEVPGFDIHTLTVDDIIDKELSNKLQELTKRFEELSKEELQELSIIQARLLNQLGLYESIEDNSPELAYLVPTEPEKPQKIRVRNRITKDDPAHK